MAKVIPIFPHLVAREKAKRGTSDLQVNTTPLTTIFARHLLLELREPVDDLTITWALGYNGLANLLAMEMWVAKRYVKLPFQLDTLQQMNALKSILRETLGQAANDGLYMPADFVPSIFQE